MMRQQDLNNIVKSIAERDKEITRLRASLAEAERDAARYRWIRYWNRVDPFRLPEDVSFEHEDAFDAIIDAAMVREEG